LILGEFSPALEDTYKHKGMRRQLVKEVARKGIKSEAVLKAIGALPRHYFFDKIFDIHAYEDKPFPIGEGQTISQPYTVAFQTELLDVKPGDKVLEIGTGSGYQAAILMMLGAEVHTIEYQKKLYERVKAFLPKLGFDPHFYFGDGSKGLPQAAPFDGIIVTAGAPTVPADLVAQLKPGGRLVIPVGTRDHQQMLLLKKDAAGQVTQTSRNYFAFVPLLGEKGW
jgi:protein-L-isoaspartate(D-aspartate) O-methyltransferase